MHDSSNSSIFTSTSRQASTEAAWAPTNVELTTVRGIAYPASSNVATDVRAGAPAAALETAPLFEPPSVGGVARKILMAVSPILLTPPLPATTITPHRLPDDARWASKSAGHLLQPMPARSGGEAFDSCRRWNFSRARRPASSGRNAHRRNLIRPVNRRPVPRGSRQVSFCASAGHHNGNAPNGFRTASAPNPALSSHSRALTTVEKPC